MVTSHDRMRWCPARGFAIAIRMTGILPSGRLRAMAALIAAYAIALQTVFATLAPMQVQADGTIAVYCSVSAVALDADEPAAPAPAPGKMPCVFCGVCAAGAVILPGAVAPAYLTIERAVSPALEYWHGTLAESHVRDGPARAPPLTV
jgi:hypothetical protein